MVHVYKKRMTEISELISAVQPGEKREAGDLIMKVAQAKAKQLM
jgi:hypothetical protein